MKYQKKTSVPLKDKLFERIETEQVSPHSRLFFQSRECLVWVLWMLSVVIGAFAVAISMFVMFHHQYALYEATHDNIFTFIVEILPYAWIVVFTLMVYVAVFNLKHTKHGYRYPVMVILGSSVVLSLAAGSALQFLGFGYTLDKVLGENMAMYMSQEKLERRLWQSPPEGRLLGRQLFSTVTPTTTVIFEDVEGIRWRMRVEELSQQDMSLLASRKTVRLLGKEMRDDIPIFYVCGVFPWMLDKQATVEEMSLERKAFLEWVYKHGHRAQDRVALLEGETFASTSLDTKSVCADIAAVRRMPKDMR